MNEVDTKMYRDILYIKEKIHEVLDTQEAIHNKTLYKLLDNAYWELNKANHLLFIKK